MRPLPLPIHLSIAVGLSLAVASCARRVGHGVDGGAHDSGAPVRDARPVVPPDGGNGFEADIVFDDAALGRLSPAALPSGAPACREPFLGRVTYVLDGDTVQVEGLEPRVRLIGVDTPELSEDQCYSDEARRFTSTLNGHLVWLTFDRDCFDVHGRLLAYVHIGPGPGDLWERQLLRRGYARVLTVAPNRALETTFEADEAAARQARTGQWSACF